jgi:hypothetical protein
MHNSNPLSVDNPGKKKTLASVILLSALLVGTLDILAAFTDFYISTGKNPLTLISKYIASGVLGKSALTGGNGMIVLGLLLHYIIATLFTIFFFFIYPRFAFLQKNWIFTGILYGIFAWAVMRFLVVPLSNTPPQKPLQLVNALKSASILIVMIGLPLAFIAKSYYRRMR